MTLFLFAATALLLITSRSYAFGVWFLAILGPFTWAVVTFPSWLGRHSATGVFCLAFGLVLFVHAWLVSPAYHAEAIYTPLTLLAAFLVFSEIAIEKTAFRVLLIVCAMLSAVAVAGWLAGNASRALFWLTTPNLFATFINVSLCPLIAYFLLGHGERRVYALIIFLLFTLFCSQSRGGYFGLMTSLFVVWLMSRKNDKTPEKRRWLQVAAGAVLAWGSVWLCSRIIGAGWDGGSRVAATLLHGDTSLRGAIYAAAMQAFRIGFPTGVGAYNFRYYFEMLKGPESADRHNNFVHNDFLQLAVENGMVGIFVTVALLVTLYVQLYRFRLLVFQQQRLAYFMAASVLTAVFAQALVDFPLYVPVFVAVVGGCLGILNRELVALGAWNIDVPHFSFPRFPGMRPGFVKRMVVIFLVVWLGLPAFAELAAAYGRHALSYGDTRVAALCYSLAREFQPHDGAAYWREASMLEQVAVMKADPGLASRADELYRRGYEENSLEVANVLGRISLHRQHRDLLAKPASPEEMMAWMMRARNLQPYSEAVQIEYVRMLVFLGKRQDAMEQAKNFVNKRPDSRWSKTLLEEAGSGSS